MVKEDVVASSKAEKISYKKLNEDSKVEFEVELEV